MTRRAACRAFRGLEADRGGAGELEPLPGKTVLPRAVPAMGASPELRLAWLDISNVAAGVDGVARSEVRSILAGAGFDVVWRQGSSGEEGRPGEIRIILVDRLLVEKDSGRPVLGATPAELRRRPHVWIHVRSVRAALKLSLSSAVHGLPVSARRDLGVALGRVIAHEIVHALVPSLPHGGELMAESLRPEDLTSPRLSVAPVVALTLRAAFEGTFASPSDEAGVLSAEGPSPASSRTFIAERETRSRPEAVGNLAR